VGEQPFFQGRAGLFGSGLLLAQESPHGVAELGFARS
jgi:hypothetical protein